MSDTRQHGLAAVAALWVLAPLSAHAHFLQTDPVGYKDDPNLYIYVKDDPVNHTDPKGLSCTGSGDKLVCKMDDPGKLSKEDVAKFNKAYTQAVKTLQSHPDATAKVTVNGKSFTVSAGQAANQLYSAKIVGTAVVNKSADMQTAGGVATQRLPGGIKQTTVFKNAFTDGDVTP